MIFEEVVLFSVSISKNLELWGLIVGTALATGTFLTLSWKRIKTFSFIIYNKLPYVKNSKRIEATMASNHTEIKGLIQQQGGVIQMVLVNQVKQGAWIKRIESGLSYGTFNADENGIITSVNDTYMQLTGRKKEDLLGRNWINTIVREDQDRIQKAWFSAIFDQRIFEEKYFIYDRDGSPQKVYVIAEPVECEKKKIVSWAGKIYDIADEN